MLFKSRGSGENYIKIPGCTWKDCRMEQLTDDGLVDLYVLSYIFKCIKVILQPPDKLSNLSGIAVGFGSDLSIHKKFFKKLPINFGL